MITQKLVNELFAYKDGNLYWKVSRSPRIKIGQEAGSNHVRGYKRIKINGKMYLTHRIIFLMFNDYMPEEVDHIDGNPLNNLIENLRSANRSENCQNRKVNYNSKTGIKNVFWDNHNKKWRVKVYKEKQIVYTNRFDDFELAQLVAVEARNKYHGDFAKCL